LTREAAAAGVCLNCGAGLHGRYCSDCGQSSDDHHRPILRLIWQWIEGLTHLDGRLARTLPLLFFHPGRLARDHLEGRVARHVPPFRLFLISLLLFMLALEGAVGGAIQGHGMTIVARRGSITKVVTATPRQMADILSGASTPEQVAGLPDAAAARSPPVAPLKAWFRDRLKRAVTDQEYFSLVVFTWAHRLAILLLPIFAGQLALIYAWRKKFYFHDHLIVATQFLAFVFLIFGLAWLAPGPARPALVDAAALWVPINLYGLLRGAYGDGRAGAVARTLWLWLTTQVIFVILVVGLLFLGLEQL
jgi:hypothetical protein